MGNITVDADVKVGDNNIESYDVTVSIPDSLEQQMEANDFIVNPFDNPEDEFNSKTESLDAEVRNYTNYSEGNLNYYELNLENVETNQVDVKRLNLNNGSVRFVQEDTVITPNELLFISTIQSSFGEDINIEYSVTMPSEIEYTNADRVEGNTAHWNISVSNPPGQLYAQTEAPEPILPDLPYNQIVLGIVALSLVAVSLWYIRIR
jgi:hypothetical protein